MERNLLVDYEADQYPCFVSCVATVTFEQILGPRDLLLCWFQDPVPVSPLWIRCPRIEVLRVLLMGLTSDGVIRLRFQSSTKSPNASPPLTPTKKPLEATVGGDKAADEWALELVNNVIEPYTQASVGQFEIDELVVLEQTSAGKSVRLTVHAESLLTQICLDAERGKNPFEVMVHAQVSEVAWECVQLTQVVWNRCLFRGNASADTFMDYVATGFKNLYGLGEKLKELHNNRDLWLRLKCFHYDLKHFEDGQSRLQDYGGEFYLSNRYFQSEELEYLLSFPTASGATARQSLSALFQSKGQFSEVCTSHDLAPAIEKIYGIRKGFETEKGFKAFFKSFVRRKDTY